MAFNLQDYETVESRLEKWWKDYPDGRVATKLEQASDTRYIVSAELFKTEADAKACATGLASESISDRGVNSTSALENCETSAIGRALANAGYAAKGKRASREEMTKVVQLQAVPQSFSVDRTEPLPISDSEWVKAALVTPPKAPPQCCAKGHNLVSGTSKTNGKPYYGYLCLDRIKEHAQWAKQNAQGAWYFPNDAEEGKGGE
jgi:hypothetical protein